jgi:hypothetical protein
MARASAGNDDYTVPGSNRGFTNSGEAYYRRGYMLVAVLKRPSVADAIRAALQTVESADAL